MNAKSFVTAGILLWCDATTLFAQSQIERELTQAKANRDKAVAVATQEINRRYQTSLEGLLIRASKNKDTAAVAAIADALKAIGNANQAPAAGAKDPIVGNWVWGGAGFNLELRADGTAPAPSGVVAHWKALPIQAGERKYQVNWPSVVDFFTLSHDGKKLTGRNSQGLAIEARRVE